MGKRRHEVGSEGMMKCRLKNRGFREVVDAVDEELAHVEGRLWEDEDGRAKE